MTSVLDPSSAAGTVLLNILATVGAATVIAAAGWLLGPLKWFLGGKRLRKILLANRRFTFVFNPINEKSKIVTFNPDGTIGEGRKSERKLLARSTWLLGDSRRR